MTCERNHTILHNSIKRWRNLCFINIFRLTLSLTSYQCSLHSKFEIHVFSRSWEIAVTKSHLTTHHVTLFAQSNVSERHLCPGKEIWHPCRRIELAVSKYCSGITVTNLNISSKTSVKPAEFSKWATLVNSIWLLIADGRSNDGWTIANPVTNSNRYIHSAPKHEWRRIPQSLS